MIAITDATAIINAMETHIALCQIYQHSKIAILNILKHRFLENTRRINIFFNVSYYMDMICACMLLLLITTSLTTC